MQIVYVVRQTETLLKEDFEKQFYKNLLTKACNQCGKDAGSRQVSQLLALPFSVLLEPFGMREGDVFEFLASFQTVVH